MPVYKIYDEMPYDELVKWITYFEERPVGWREDERTHKLLQAQGVKERATNIFPSLAAVYASIERLKTKQEGTSIKQLEGSMLFHKMLSAKGGEKIFNDKDKNTS